MEPSMPDDLRNQQPEAEFVSFFAGGQSFSLSITRVREIRRWSPVTALPNTGKDLLGVMNLRGSVIPIYDLAARMGLPATAECARNVIVVATDDQQTVGLLVEAVSEIVSIDPARIQDTSEIRLESARKFVTGVITVDEGMTRVIDLGAVIQPVAKVDA
jgi:purine-binding chemotaxis protein CheW